MSAEAQARLRAQLPDTGDSATISVPAGATVSRAGVDFTCNSAYDCTVALENSLGTIVAMWSSQVLEGQDDPTLTAMATGPTTASGSIDLSDEVMGNLNAGPMPYPQTLMIADGGMKRVNGVVFSCNTGGTSAYCTVTLSQGDDGTIMATWSSEVAYGVDPAENPGMASVYDPMTQMNRSSAEDIANAVANAGDSPTGRDVDVVANSRIAKTGSISGVAIPEATGLAGPAGFSGVGVTAMLDPNGPAYNPANLADLATSPGTTVGAMDDIETAATGMPGDANAVRLAGWQHRAMHADWGDTRDPKRDGGYETFALLYSNIEGPSDVKFSDAGTVIADNTIRAWFTLTGGVTGNINTASGGGATQQQIGAIRIGPAAALPELTRTIEADAQIRGTYFGAAGTFTCGSAGDCQISRASTAVSMFSVRDTNPATDGIQGSGTWTFTPDADATVNLPDQDWIAFGVWVTSPDTHTNANDDSVGTFEDGMDTYGYDPSGTVLTGKATYSGGAAGVYVDGSDSGLFTATAKLEANFDDDELSGSINDFQDTSGRYLGADTQANRNDPATGGESDWVVDLDTASITDGGVLDGAPATSGSADGNSWDGEWAAQLYGGGDRQAAGTGDDFIGHAPSGVAGTFNARTDNLGTATDPTFKGVAGAFGATLDAGSHVAAD